MITPITSLFFLITFPIIVPCSEASPEIAWNHERIDLLKTALGWMTFRKDGKLMTDGELDSLFFQPLRSLYKTSKYYRTFVIAFEQGVLPRLTLDEGDYCDPNSREMYRDPSNSSVTTYYQKKFTFDMYDKRGSAYNRFCDYRKGLVCSWSSRTCECPEGSKMEKVDPRSDVERCVLQENQVCALIDLANGNDLKHSLLQKQLPYMIFNLEKPLGCQAGTQCRFKSGNKNTPLCYANNNGPWETGSWRLKLGDDCALGLHGDTGTCDLIPNFWSTCLDPKVILSWPGSVCYNFGAPRSSGTSKMDNRVGVCHYENGEYGIIPPIQWLGSISGSGNHRVCDGINPEIEYFLSVYVHPGTVPLRGQKLRDYYQKVREAAVKKNEIQVKSGRCSVDHTNKWKQLWEHFEGLAEDPPSGQDYVPGATEVELDAKMEAVLELGRDSKKKVCQVYVHYSFPDSGVKEVISIEVTITSVGRKITSSWQRNPSFQCQSDGSPDADGNDGVCQRDYGDYGGADAEKHRDKFELDVRINARENSEETSYREEILEKNPELPCDPTRAPNPPIKLRSSIPPATLDGGECLDGSVCYQDFSDAQGNFDADCNLKVEAKQVLICHDVEASQLGKCEKSYLEGKVSQALHHLADYASLTKGEPCFHDFERTVRENNTEVLAKYNPYQIMSWLDRGFLCDRFRRNLECASIGFCQCINGNCLEEGKPSVGRPRPKPGGTGGTSSGTMEETEEGEGDDEDDDKTPKKHRSSSSARVHGTFTASTLVLVVVVRDIL